MQGTWAILSIYTYLMSSNLKIYFSSFTWKIRKNLPKWTKIKNNSEKRREMGLRCFKKYGRMKKTRI